jgi:HlyD family secretion protein
LNDSIPHGLFVDPSASAAMKRRVPVVIAGLVALAVGVYYATSRRVQDIVLTGIVTTDGVIVSSEVQGRVQQLLVKEGDQVKQGQLLALIHPDEWRADMAFYADSERQSAAHVAQAEADLRYQETQTRKGTEQAEARLAAAKADLTQGQADLENARLNFEREQTLYHTGVESAQAYDQARTVHAAAKAHVEALRKQVEAAQAALALVQSTADQVAMRRAALEAEQHQLAAASAQKDKAQVHLGYTELHAPIDGIVDVRAALPGEVVKPGQGIVTLVNPDDLWVRADVEESYIDRIRLGDTMTVRLPSGAALVCPIFYRGVDADYATQRDVSRTKRDIKTFEIRLRCDNSARTLAVGMTAYVTLPLSADRT